MIMINTTLDVLIKCTKYGVLISNMSLNQVHHRLPFRCFFSILHIVKGRNSQKQFLGCNFFLKNNCILLPKLFWPTVRKNRKKTFEFRGWMPRICKIFGITRTIYSNSERSAQILVTECFLTCSWRFLISNKLEQLEFK